MNVALVRAAKLLLKLPLMHPQQLRKKASWPIPSCVPDRRSIRSNSYLKTRIRGSRLRNAARILAVIELTQRLHQAYAQAYDKQAAEWLLPQNPPTKRDPLEVKKQFYDLHGKDLNDCIKKVFKGDAAKVPTQTILNAAALNVHRTRRQLGRLAGGGRPIGYSGEGGPTDTIYIARDVFNGNTPNTMNAIFGTYAHELGIILDIKLNPSPPPGTLGFTYGDPNDPEDKDTGAAIEKCLFGSLQWP